MNVCARGMLFLGLICTLCGTAWSEGSKTGAFAPPPLVSKPDAPIVSHQSMGEPDPICGEETFTQKVVELTNIERFQNGGLPPLKGEDRLFEAAGLHSVNMAERNFFAHCDLDTKKSPWTRMRDAGYYWNWAGENAATGQSSPERVVTGWMNSSGHRANILGDFREIGVGYHYFSGDTPDTRTDADRDCDADGELGYSTYRYWTQKFGARNGIYPVIVNLEAHISTERTVGLYVHGEGWGREMRIRSGDGNWSSWMPFASESAWNLTGPNGFHTVTVEIRSSSGAVKTASDQICLLTEESDGDERPPPEESLFSHSFE